MLEVRKVLKYDNLPTTALTTKLGSLQIQHPTCLGWFFDGPPACCNNKSPSPRLGNYPFGQENQICRHCCRSFQCGTNMYAPGYLRRRFTNCGFPKSAFCSATATARSLRHADIHKHGTLQADDQLWFKTLTTYSFHI